jgi:hypothetical protein
MPLSQFAELLALDADIPRAEVIGPWPDSDTGLLDDDDDDAALGNEGGGDG